MDILGKIVAVKGGGVEFKFTDRSLLSKLSLDVMDEPLDAVIRLGDNRHISPAQQRKAYALLDDIAAKFGWTKQEIKATMKYRFGLEYGIDDFSLSNTDMTTAREFINFLLEYVIEHGVPLKNGALELQDDLDTYMYLSLKHRSCVVCGRHADVHHIETVGMGNDRRFIDHREKELIALCRVHHNEAHNMGWPSFSELYHVKGIRLDAKTLNDLHIMSYKRMEEIDRDKSSHFNRSAH
jgi:hypothetical protein